GTFVAETRARAWLLQSSGGVFQEEVERMGRQVTSGGRRPVVRGSLPGWATAALGLTGAEGATLERVRSIDGYVAMFNVNHLPPGLGELVLPLDDPNESLYQRLQERAGVEAAGGRRVLEAVRAEERKSTRLNSSHRTISYAVFCLKKKKILKQNATREMRLRLGKVT